MDRKQPDIRLRCPQLIYQSVGAGIAAPCRSMQRRESSPQGLLCIYCPWVLQGRALWGAFVPGLQEMSRTQSSGEVTLAAGSAWCKFGVLSCIPTTSSCAVRGQSSQACSKPH